MIEKQNPSIFKSLSLAYSKINDEARSFLSLAEYNCLIGKKTKCRKYAAKAKEKFKASDKLELLQIEDLIEISKIGEKNQPKEKDDE
jgi:predicted Zn-dependent protease